MSPSLASSATDITTYTAIAESCPTEGKVLVVDDDAAFRGLAALMLESMGYQAITASNGLEALKTIEKQTVDLVLLDVLMPVMNGEQALRAIRATWPELRVVMISGFDAATISERLGDVTPDCFLQKPLSFDKLTSTLSALHLGR